jgi:uncharacterized protein (DUF302 family)
VNQASQTVHEFKGVRLEIRSSLSFDEVLRRLQEQTGSSAVTQINEVAATTTSIADFESEITRRFVGPSGFMLFAKIEHGPWIATYGLKRRVLRIILGNPLLAITMMREDLSAGLFAPVEILLVDDIPGSTLYYVRPSSLMVVTENPRLKEAAVKLDHKLENLIATITGLSESSETRDTPAA